MEGWLNSKREGCGMSKKEILWHIIILWASSSVGIWVLWTGLSHIKNEESPFPFLMTGVATLVLSVIISLAEMREVKIKNRLNALEKENLVTKRELAEDCLSPRECAEIIFYNLEAIVNFLNGYPEKISATAIGLGHNLIYVALPETMLLFLKNNKTLLAQNCPDDDSHTHTVISNNMLLSEICKILDQQEQFARSLLGKLGPEDHFQLDVDGIETPEGVKRDISSGRGVFIKGTLADFVRWVAKSNLKESTEEEEK